MSSPNNNQTAFGAFWSDTSVDSSMTGATAAGAAPAPHNCDAAEAAVANLENILPGQRGVPAAVASPSPKKRTPDALPSAELEPRKKPLTNARRQERNLREKERSLKITQQITELRNLLSAGGVIVPKGTKSTTLTEVGNYIRALQQQQYQSEVDKAQLVQEVQRIGNGAMANKAAAELPGASPDALGDREYRGVFDSCSVGMAIATMGGAFLDCNLAFTELSSYTRGELKAMTIFNITSRDDLQAAFDILSHLITPESAEEGKAPPPVVLRSAVRHRRDLGHSVALIRGEDNLARHFIVTLVQLPPSPAGLAGPAHVPAAAEMSQQAVGVPKQNMYPNMNAPQYATG